MKHFAPLKFFVVKKKREKLFYLFLLLNPNLVSCKRKKAATGSVAEWSKAPDSGSGPQGRGFKSLRCHCHHLFFMLPRVLLCCLLLVNVICIFEISKR